MRPCRAHHYALHTPLERKARGVARILQRVSQAVCSRGWQRVSSVRGSCSKYPGTAPRQPSSCARTGKLAWQHVIVPRAQLNSLCGDHRCSNSAGGGLGRCCGRVLARCAAHPLWPPGEQRRAGLRARRSAGEWLAAAQQVGALLRGSQGRRHGAGLRQRVLKKGEAGTVGGVRGSPRLLPEFTAVHSNPILRLLIAASADDSCQGHSSPQQEGPRLPKGPEPRPSSLLSSLADWRVSEVPARPALLSEVL